MAKYGSIAISEETSRSILCMFVVKYYFCRTAKCSNDRKISRKRPIRVMDCYPGVDCSLDVVGSML